MRGAEPSLNPLAKDAVGPIQTILETDGLPARSNVQ